MSHEENETETFIGLNEMERKILDELSIAIFNYIEDKNWSIAYFADYCGISKNTIHRLLNSRRSANITLETLCKTLIVIGFDLNIYPNKERTDFITAFLQKLDVKIFVDTFEYRLERK